MNKAQLRRKRSNIKYIDRERKLFFDLPIKEQKRILFHKKLFLDTNTPNHHFEKWVTLPFSDGYSISNYCRIKNQSGKIIKPHLHHSHYYDVCILCNREKKYFIRSKLLATYFIANKENKNEANHKNGIRSDNRKSNIEWATESENILHSFDVLKRDGRVPVIQKDLDGNVIREWESIASINKELGYNCGNIVTSCKSGNTGYGFKWKYKKGLL